MNYQINHMPLAGQDVLDSIENRSEAAAASLHAMLSFDRRARNSLARTCLDTSHRRSREGVREQVRLRIEMLADENADDFVY